MLQQTFLPPIFEFQDDSVACASAGMRTNLYYFEERILSVCATSLLLESSLIDKSNEMMMMMMMIELGDTKIKVKD